MRRTVNADNGGPSPPLSAKCRVGVAATQLALTQPSDVRIVHPVPTIRMQMASHRPAKSASAGSIPALISKCPCGGTVDTLALEVSEVTLVEVRILSGAL
ncbi:hypothetical protein LCGC14_2715360 [marine sediment metagenome]|uniref:Uncharacterized protein n=1 Tax=marine sediment metagenome TaxID=412755 RepID=A0A0F8ZBQ4_9ZZZZ